jgi:hypothetical protein
MSTPVKGRRIRGGERKLFAASVRAMYDAGHSVRDIADVCERSYGFTHRLLTETGGLRPRGGSKRVAS